MRDLVITLIVFGSIPAILMRPYIGVLMWSWIGYMNPHRLSWGFAYSFPFAQVTALALIVSLFFYKGSKKIPVNGITVIWGLFIVWMMMTTLFAVHPDDAFTQLQKVLKIQLVTFFTLMLMKEREKLHALIWVIFLSLGFFGIKGGIFTILTGGANRVWGPPGSFIEGNNELALATLMVVPLGYYLLRNTKNKWIRYGLLAAMPLMVISAIGSQSRGALIAFGTVLFFFWLKSKSKIITGTLGILLAIGVVTFMPQSWHDRMSTIENYEEDRSAMGRINAWHMAFNLAKDRVTGGGFELWGQDMFQRYAPDPLKIHDAHSIYFEVLGEHGFIGLFCFLLIGLMSFRQAGKLIKWTKNDEDLHWLNDLMRMLQVCLIAYASGGAFLGMAYFDLYWHFISFIVLGRYIYENRQAAAMVGDTSEKRFKDIREKTT